jgi:hypothetical protein
VQLCGEFGADGVAVVAPPVELAGELAADLDDLLRRDVSRSLGTTTVRARSPNVVWMSVLTA